MTGTVTPSAACSWVRRKNISAPAATCLPSLEGRQTVHRQASRSCVLAAKRVGGGPEPDRRPGVPCRRRRPIEGGSNLSFFQFVQGLADYREGKFNRTISTMRGDAASALGPAPRLVLGMALYQLGEMDQARRSLEMAISSYDWNAAALDDQDNWIVHTLRRELERMLPPIREANLEKRWDLTRIRRLIKVRRRPRGARRGRRTRCGRPCVGRLRGRRPPRGCSGRRSSGA